ncbi:hypothetical protein EWE75_06880 [Sphingomonas populi]|uniref:Uncharacterized protein n=1 Tax=Sphingomonas populi TaxID=2484750 RepID=A0A4V2DDI4_9SPHN|nr:hypothetical protein [Sphingomonas populi]RZF65098.1 hypothetical protein EWE75_06880 [Sphingomonas populi]
MQTSAQFRRLHRHAGIDRFAGLPPQFERSDRGWLFRRYGHGPAIRVSDDEYARFMRTGLWAVILHGVALIAFGAFAWLLLDRILPGWSGNARAPVFGVVLSLIALALQGSLRHYADAPTRVLVDRPPERPARDPDASMQPNYTTIIALVLFLLFMAAIGTQQPASFYIAFATASVTLGVVLAIRRLRFDRILTVAQRERLREQRVTELAIERARRKESDPLWKGAVLLVFVALELVVIGGGIILGVGIAQAIAGQTSDDMGFGVFMLGFLPGLAFGALLFWPLEKLCKRWTGYSALHAFDWIPPGW